VTTLEPSPEWEDVRQHEEFIANVVPVKVEGVSRVVDMPAKRAANFHLTVPNIPDGGSPVEIIPGDPRIKNAWILNSSGSTNSAWLGTREQLSKQGELDGFIINPGFVIGPLQGFEESMYAISITSPGSILSIRLEYWSD
jgi:hypothetical protein